MSTNADVLIAILQGGGTNCPRDGDDAVGGLDAAWRRQPSHFVASNDLQHTKLRFHVTTVELPDAPCDSEEHLLTCPNTYQVAPDAAVPSVLLVCQLHYLGEFLTPLVHSSVCATGRRYTTPHPCKQRDGVQNDENNDSHDDACDDPLSTPPSQPPARTVWWLDEWVEFPIPVSDVPLDADVVCTVYVAKTSPHCCTRSPVDDNAEDVVASLFAQGATTTATKSHNNNETHIGGAWVRRGVARVFPFSSAGELRTGTHDFSLQQPRQTDGDSSFADPLPPQLPMSAPLRTSQRLQTGQLQSIPWLDLVTEQHLSQTERHVSRVASRPRPADSVVCGAALSGCLQLSFPLASNRLPILQLPLLLAHTTAVTSNNNNNNSIGSVSQRNAVVPGTAGSVMELVEPSSALASTTRRPFMDRYNDVHQHEWSEALATLQAHSLFLTYKTSALPDYKDRQRLSTLLQRPPVSLEPLRVQEALLLWQYREFIRHDARYFLLFMRSVPWRQSQSSEERRVAEALIPLWKPIPFADVLACLSCEFHGVRAIRNYAVRLLARESDTRLTRFATPLLQAMLLDDPTDRELGSFLIARSLHCWELCSALFWGATVEIAEEDRILTARQTAAATAPSSALPMSVTGPFTAWRDRQQHALLQHQPYFVALLRQEQRAHQWLRTLADRVDTAGGDRTFKNEIGQRLLEKKSCGLKALFDRHDATPANLATTSESTSGGSGGPSAGTGHVIVAAAQGDSVASNAVVATSASSSAAAAAAAGVLPYAPVTLPTHPAIALHTVARQSFFMFKSATLPFRVSFFASPLELPPNVASQRRSPRPHDDTRDVRDAASDVPTSSDSNTRALVVRRPLAMPADWAASTASSSAAAAAAAAPARAGTFAALASASSASPSPSSSSPAYATSTTAATPTTTAADALRATPSSAQRVVQRPPPLRTFSLSLLYKWNDDVRQDQLVVQLIQLMDNVLRLDGLDLCLTPYSVVATGPSEGLVEIVPDVVTLQSVQKDVRGYLSRFHRTADALERAMERYTKSFAGYSIITFVLGIGDRHLENILLTQDGRLLHIDFAYMFGCDPKPFAPPMKINAEMIEALGGPQSRGYQAFRSYCCSAYHTLRKHASLLLYTLQLMVYANGMPQLTGSAQPLAGEPLLTPSPAGSRLSGAKNATARMTGPSPAPPSAVASASSAAATAPLHDPRINVLKVQEKLRMDLTNAQATQFLQNVMADSVGSLFTNLWDTLHAAAQATRA